MDQRTRLRDRRLALRTQPSASLETWKSVASIISAVMIPVVLALVGYFIQRQLADEGLKKDYVSIAAGISKENPAMQEPDLRKWAVKVLDENSPIAFSGKAKESLERGPRMQYMAPIYIPEPDENCMEPPPDRTVGDLYVKLAKYSQQKNVYGDEMLPKLHEFVEAVRRQEVAAIMTSAHLKCLQSWVRIAIRADESFRQIIEAPTREEEHKKYLESQEKKTSEQKTMPANALSATPTIKK